MTDQGHYGHGRAGTVFTTAEHGQYERIRQSRASRSTKEQGQYEHDRAGPVGAPKSRDSLSTEEQGQYEHRRAGTV